MATDPLAALPSNCRVRITVTDECWLWTGATDHHGYGQVRISGRVTLAHRAVYTLLIGPIPAGLVIDHLCRVTNCVRPTHLEPVTQAENTRRGVGLGSFNRLKTHCPARHPYDEVNTYIDPRGRRSCRQCWRDRDAVRPSQATAGAR